MHDSLKPTDQKPQPTDAELPAAAKTSQEADDAVIGRALGRSLIVAATLLGAVGGYTAVTMLLREKEENKVVKVEPPRTRQQQVVELPEIRLTDVTQESGIDFRHSNGAAGEKLLPETMGSGVAWLDYNQDGNQDLFFVNSKPWDWSDEGATVGSCRLYAGDGQGSFQDVSAEAGLDIVLYGMGAAVGDYDNDGWIDVFISSVGPNRLYRNVEGKFVEVTQEAGVAGEPQQWSTSCGFLDYDNDGRLDLFVCNYVQWSRDADLSQSFSIDGTNRAYGPPRAFAGTFSYLYHNEGEGNFRDVTAEAGLQVRNRDTDVPLGKAMGVAPIDIDGDGDLDIVVANDTVRNFLFANQGDGTFRESGELCGIAYDRDGNARGAMGIDAAAFRDDGTVAIGIGNFANEPSALYMASGPASPQFNDLAMATGLGPQTRLGLTFGLFFFDADLDGRLDLLGANGHLEQEIHKVQNTQYYEQAPQLFWNAGKAGGSQMIPLPEAQTGDGFTKPLVGRGAAYADFDNDGDLDVVLTANGGQPRLFRNDQTGENHWLRFHLKGSQANRSAIGARVDVTAGDRKWSRVVMPTRSYLSQCELPVTFGLGELTSIDSVTVTWPGGQQQAVKVTDVDQTIEVKQE